MTPRERHFVHWEGRVLPAEQARVSVFDAGYLYGDGIYETMRAYGGCVFALGRHLERLERSAERVALQLPSLEEIRRAVTELIAANDMPDAALRVTVTRGRLKRRLDLSTAGTPSLLVTMDPVDELADERRRAGSRVVTSRYLRLSRYPLAGVKSTNYQISLFARNEAREAGALEVLLPNETGEIVEAAAANVFLVEGERLVTPPLDSGILSGITREVVLEVARERKLAVELSTLARERIASADELFLTGTTIQVAPVIEVDGQPVGTGAAGRLTLALLDGYLAAVRKDTGAPVVPSGKRS
jgi:branched-chain amino acid aminotransferase